MDLKTFISSTLAQIVEGIAEASEAIAARGTNASVNPIRRGHDSKMMRGDPEPVEFDVAVTTSEDTQSGLKGGIKVAGVFSLGGDTHDKTTSASVSRIKFVFQLAQPSTVEVKEPSVPLPYRDHGF